MMQLPADDVEESQEDEKRGDRSSKGGASLLESQQGWAKSRRRVWEVEGERVSPFLFVLLLLAMFTAVVVSDRSGLLVGME